MLHITHSVLRLENYLLPKSTGIQLAKFTFHARNRMLDLKTNFKNKAHTDFLCPVCKDPASLDSQQHLLQCALLTDNQVAQLDDVPEYGDLFSTNVKKQIAVATLLASMFCVY